MNSHNSKSQTDESNEPVRIETDHKDVRILRSKIVDAPELSIEDDRDNGGDPYNTTGQHVVLELKNDLEE